MIKAIIFDMDGVLIDTEDLHIQAEKKVLGKYGVMPDKEDEIEFKGRPFRGIIVYINKKYNKNIDKETALKGKYELMEDILPKIKIFKWTRKSLDELKNRFRFALTTSTIKDFTDKVLSHFDLKHYFEVIVTADDITKGKPNPEPYLVTMQKLGLNAEECIVVEDAANGIISAKCAGANCVAITTTFPKGKLTMADVVIDNLNELSQLRLLGGTK